jgi:hypothetical protein
MFSVHYLANLSIKAARLCERPRSDIHSKRVSQQLNDVGLLQSLASPSGLLAVPFIAESVGVQSPNVDSSNIPCNPQ